MATPGAMIGDRYRLVRELGSGGMSVVWEAQDERLDRRVAVKQFRLQPGLNDQDARTVAERAMREARINARLQHPHAVAVFDAVQHEGRPCLVMEMVSSRTLADALRESASHTMEPSEVARVGSQVASALAAAHGLGIVHRDIKPSNILLGADGRARISDFGISRAIGDSTLTMTGMISGTPAYLAPEVARGHESSTASDVFSLGATLYASVEGGPPFGTDGNLIALLYRVAEGAVPTPRQAGELAPLLGCMLARDPGARPVMAEVAATLTRLGGADSDSLSRRGTDASTVAIPPPTGARPPIAEGAALGPGGAAAIGVGSTVHPDSPAALVQGVGRSAATPTAFRSTTTPPTAGDRVIPSNRSRRRGLITAAVAVMVLVAVVAVASVLWPHTLAPEPTPNASAVSDASEQPTEEPASKESGGQDSENSGSDRTKATDKSAKKTSAEEKPTQSNEPTETSAGTQSPEPSQTEPEGNGKSGNGNNSNGNNSADSKDHDNKNGHDNGGNNGHGNSGNADRP